MSADGFMTRCGSRLMFCWTSGLEFLDDDLLLLYCFSIDDNH
jgi:hypothetical protein